MTVAMVAVALAAVAIASLASELDRYSARRRPRGAVAAGGPAGSNPDPAPDRNRGRLPAELTAHPAGAHALAGAVAGCAGLLLAGPLPAALLGAVGGASSLGWARRAAAGRRRRRERAMPAFARSLADALRGGSSIRGALTETAQDRSVPDALRTELAATADAVRLGASLEGGLVALAGRGGPGLRLACGAIAMHVESGGALARELERLAENGEAALRIDEERIAATAQARATVRVVAALPVLALLGAEAASGSFVATIAGNALATALLALGFVLEVAAIVAARVIVGGR